MNFGKVLCTNLQAIINKPPNIEYYYMAINQGMRGMQSTLLLFALTRSKRHFFKFSMFSPCKKKEQLPII